MIQHDRAKLSQRVEVDYTTFVESAKTRHKTNRGDLWRSSISQSHTIPYVSGEYRPRLDLGISQLLPSLLRILPERLTSASSHPSSEAAVEAGHPSWEAEAEVLSKSLTKAFESNLDGA